MNPSLEPRESYNRGSRGFKAAKKNMQTYHVICMASTNREREKGSTYTLLGDSLRLTDP